MSAMPNEAMDTPATEVAGVGATGPADAEARRREINQTFAGPLLRYLTSLASGNRELAEASMQETLLRASRNVDVLPTDPDRLERWLFTVARNVVSEAVRGSAAVRGRYGGLARPNGQALTGRSVRQALRTLRPQDREVLIEVYFRGSSTADVAARLGIEESTVKARSYHAIRALHRAVGSTEPALTEPA